MNNSAMKHWHSYTIIVITCVHVMCLHVRVAQNDCNVHIHVHGALSQR